MLKLESLDLRFFPLEKELAKLAHWMIKKTAKGEIKTKKQLQKKADFYLEIYLVNSKTLAKNVYAYEFPKGFPSPQTKATALGEIYLNPKIIKEQGYSLNYMAIHGFLHLLGYEHKAKSDTIAMEMLEQKLLKEFKSIS
ncbi:MAG: rRNA maturation RNAse YbeY [bacterium]|nr:rRNA maturation RNAse YbeY [bacterium]